MSLESLINKRLEESFSVKKKMTESNELQSSIKESAEIILESYQKSGGCIFFAGNGGSAADAQHLAAELVGRFYLNRKSLNAEAITANSSSVTAIANDFGYENIFSRCLEGKGKAGDVFIGITTSGNSENIVNALLKCKELGIKTIGFSGARDGKIDSLCDVIIKIPSEDTPRVQEGHILVGHIICELVEKEMFPNV